MIEKESEILRTKVDLEVKELRRERAQLEEDRSKMKDAKAYDL